MSSERNDYEEGHSEESQRAPVISYSRWTLMTCATIFIGSLGFILLNVWIDIFGLYWRQDARPHLLERYSYHLLSEHFIANHFDEILLGSSQSGNWNTSLIPGHRIYNVSCGGSNLHEEVLLAHKVLASGHLKGIYIFMYPSMMSDTALPTAYLTDKDRQGALGSVQNLFIYAEALKDRLMAFLKHNPRLGEKYYPFGGHPIRRGKKDTRPALPPSFWQPAPVAEEDLRTVLSQARSEHAKVYFVIPPIYAPYYNKYQDNFDSFFKEMAKAGGSDVSTIDLLHDPSLQAIRQVKGNYPDLLHPVDAITPAIVNAMARQINATAP